jgi:hypothetical protein
MLPMAHEYLIPQDIVQRLEVTGLVQRAEEALKDPDKLNPICMGCIFEDEAAAHVKWMQDDGYFSDDPDYLKQLERAVPNIHHLTWKLKRGDAIQLEPAKLEDITLLSGLFAAQALSPEEFRQFESFGFRSERELATALSVYMQENSGSIRERDFNWTFEKDGKIYRGTVTGNCHLDLVIMKDDVTPHPTTDPLGNFVPFRPLMRSDQTGIYPHHSTEGQALVATMKYIEQEGIPSKIVDKDKYRAFVDHILAGGQRIGAATECLISRSDDPIMLFIPYEHPMPRLDGDNNCDDFSPYCLASMGHMYCTYVDSRGNMVFASPKKDDAQKKEVHLSIHPEEVDHLIEGLFVQSASGQGRTHAGWLAQLLEYKLSGRADKELAELRSSFKRS